MTTTDSTGSTDSTGTPRDAFGRRISTADTRCALDRCAADYCDGRRHVDATGHVWTEPLPALTVCATFGCDRPARWFPVPEANRKGRKSARRCAGCCDAYPWVQVTGGEGIRVRCLDCDWSSDELFDSVPAASHVADVHAAWHLGESLARRISGM